MSFKYILRQFAVVAVVLAHPHFGLSAASTSEMSAGGPGHTEILGTQTFLPVELRQLSHAELWYLRYDSLRRRGISIPPEGIKNRAFADWYLSQNAYQAPGPEDRPEMFTNKTKTAYADFYGGEGNHAVQGSGRATLNGLDQHKGNLTPMVPLANRDPNMNGAQQVIDSMEEAVWSEILHNEFRYGANETFDVIFTGNYARHSSGQIFPRGLQGRYFAIRMAHFMLRPGPVDPTDLARVKSIMPNLIKALPYPANFKATSPGEALRVGLLEFAHREAYTQAEYYAKRIYFGSDSPSNVTIQGERKDLTAHSAFLGYSRVYRPIAEGAIPFGTIDEALLTFDELQDSLSKTLPKDLLPYLPTRAEFRAYFKQTYEHQQQVEMARLVGAPAEMMTEIENGKVLASLGKILVRISKAGNDRDIPLNMDGITYTDRYQLNKMLTDLSSLNVTSSAEVEARLQKWIPDDTDLRRELAHAYFDFRAELESRARSEGMTSQALDTYIKEAARMRNQDRPELVLSKDRVAKFWEVADHAIATHDGHSVEQFIQGLVDRNTFNFKDVAPYQVVLKQTRRPAEGLVVREVYDAKRGQYVSIVRVHVPGGEGYLNGGKYNIKDLVRLNPSYEGQSAEAQKSGEYVEFHFNGIKSIDATKLKIIPNQLSKERPFEIQTHLPKTCEGFLAG